MTKKVLILLVMCGTFATALARADDTSVKYKAAESAHINIHQAIDMAEKQSEGKVTRVNFVLRGNSWFYDIDVLTAAGPLTMEIDASSGSLRPASAQR
jgi:uncharacterized membrane protein YkoI